MAKARVELHGPDGAQWAELVIDGPPLNLFDAAMVADLAAAIDTLPTSGARAVLLRAEGKVFCAGVDVKEFMGKTVDEGAELMGSYLAMVHALEALPMPTIAVIHSLCLTIGLELALGCDLMWGAEEASLGLVEATVGLTPGGGGTQRLVARAGVARAAEAVLTGAIYKAEVFREWGVINRVLPREGLLEQAREYAGKLAAGPTFAAGVAKVLLRTARDSGVGAADAITGAQTGLVFPTEDLRAGVESLLANGPGKATYVGR